MMGEGGGVQGSKGRGIVRIYLRGHHFRVAAQSVLRELSKLDQEKRLINSRPLC